MSVKSICFLQLPAVPQLQSSPFNGNCMQTDVQNPRKSPRLTKTQAQLAASAFGNLPKHLTMDVAVQEMKPLGRLARCCSRCAGQSPPRTTDVWTGWQVPVPGTSQWTIQQVCEQAALLMRLFSGKFLPFPVPQGQPHPLPGFGSPARTCCGHAVASPGCPVPAQCTAQDAVSPWALCCCTRIKARSRWGGGRRWLLLMGSAKLSRT